MIRVSILGAAGVLLGMILKGTKPEYSFYISIGIGLSILGLAVGKLQYLFESIREIRAYLPIDSSYLTIILKMIGISYIGQFSSGICKDAGFTAIAGQIEIFGKLVIMALSMPVLLALLETVHGFLG